MKRLAIIKNGLVENVVIVEEGANWDAPELLTKVELPDNSPVGIGWTHNGGQDFTAPVQVPDNRPSFIAKKLFVERLAQAGLLTQFLNWAGANQLRQERWRAMTKVNTKNQNLRSAITTLGGEPDVVLAQGSADDDGEF